MQYNKQEDGTYLPLKQHNVDTGLGLERMSMIMQQVGTIFETDLLAPIVRELKITLPEIIKTRSLYIIADHLRTSIFMIADGVIPNNKDRGYVLRRLLRRAILHSQFENTDWIENIVDVVIEIYRKDNQELWYPNLETEKENIIRVIRDEAHKFQRTLKKGMQEIVKREDLSGKEAFDLYQTYGFPLELTIEYATEKGVKIDRAEFEQEFKAHQEMSRTAAAGQFKSGLADHSDVTIKYHTGAHLLLQALRNNLGEHVIQRGSNITPERIRFDFSHPEKLSEEQIQNIENEVNNIIDEGYTVTVDTMSPDQAIKEGALGVFTHKYGDTVTVYTIGGKDGKPVYSKEICTGPHVTNTKEIGHLKITKQEAVSAGVRRIKAVII